MEKATKRQIIRRTEQEKLDLIAQWEKSGHSIKEFCNRHQFSDSLFHSWLNKYRRQKQKPTPPAQDFIPLPITAPASMPTNSPALFAEVILKGGSHIRFYQPVDVNDLRALTTA
jgi:transposase-like protein